MFEAIYLLPTDLLHSAIHRALTIYLFDHKEQPEQLGDDTNTRP